MQRPAQWNKAVDQSTTTPVVIDAPSLASTLDIGHVHGDATGAYPPHALGSATPLPGAFGIMIDREFVSHSGLSEDSGIRDCWIGHPESIEEEEE